MVGGESREKRLELSDHVRPGLMSLAAPTTGRAPIKLSDPLKAQGSGGATRANDPERAPGMNTDQVLTVFVLKNGYSSTESQKEKKYCWRETRNWTKYGVYEREAEKKNSAVG
ncbi:hypothetical protein V8C42DRAFT_244757 [Trichoderma barbatum]